MPAVKQDVTVFCYISISQTEGIIVSTYYYTKWMREKN